ncbi:hypothetical protein Tco_0195364 [Tanacetum coccineum]
MALADEDSVSVGKESARNGEWIKISMKKVHTLLEMEDRKSFLDDLSRPKDPVFVKSLVDNSEVSITGSNKPNLSEAEDSTLSNHDTGKHPFPPLEKLTGAEPVSGPKTIKSILKSKSTFKAETLKAPADFPRSASAVETAEASSNALRSKTPTKRWICQILQENSQKRTRERLSDQEAREIMPQPSTVNCS